MKAIDMHWRIIGFNCVIALLMTLLCHWIYYRPVYFEPQQPIQLADSTYSMLLSETLLTRGHFHLEHLFPESLAEREKLRGFEPTTGYPYQMVPKTNDGHVYYGYPLGSTLLALPLVEFYRQRDLHAGQEPFADAEIRETEYQLRIAAWISSLSVGCLFLLARQMLPLISSILIACTFAFATPVWSTMTRALWSHDFAVLILVAHLMILVRIEKFRLQQGSIIPIWYGIGLGFLGFWLLLVRPHGIISLGGIGLYLLITSRKQALATIISFIVCQCIWVAICYSFFQDWKPPSVYQVNTIDFQNQFTRLYGLLFSPSRGLFVYCPYLLLLPITMYVVRKQIIYSRLWLAILSSSLVHLGIFCNYEGWWGGASYGPRYFTDMLPWYFLAIILITAACQKNLQDQPKWTFGRWFRTILWITTITFSCWIHFRGATVHQTWLWNGYLGQQNRPEIVLDWTIPQFLSGFTFQVYPNEKLVFEITQ